MRHIRPEFPGWMKLRRRGNRSCAGNQEIDFSRRLGRARRKPCLPKAILEPAIPQQTTLQKIENSSETQLAEIVVAHLNALKRRFRLVVFDEVVLDAGLL